MSTSVDTNCPRRRRRERPGHRDDRAVIPRWMARNPAAQCMHIGEPLDHNATSSSRACTSPIGQWTRARDVPYDPLLLASDVEHCRAGSVRQRCCEVGDTRDRIRSNRNIAGRCVEVTRRLGSPRQRSRTTSVPRLHVAAPSKSRRSMRVWCTEKPESRGNPDTDVGKLAHEFVSRGEPGIDCRDGAVAP